MTALDPRVFDFARERASAKGEFNFRVFGEMLIWPKATRGCPDYWRAYAADWPACLGVPDQLAPATAAAVLHVLVGAMKRDTHDRASCFLAQRTIAQRAHSSVRTVARVLAWQKDVRRRWFGRDAER